VSWWCLFVTVAVICLQVVGRHGVLDEAFKRLTSRNADEFWTSGQWMTERKGGSDVGLWLTSNPSNELKPNKKDLNFENENRVRTKMKPLHVSQSRLKVG